MLTNQVSLLRGTHFIEQVNRKQETVLSTLTETAGASRTAATLQKGENNRGAGDRFSYRCTEAEHDGATCLRRQQLRGTAAVAAESGLDGLNWAVEGTFKRYFQQWKGGPCFRRLQARINSWTDGGSQDAEDAAEAFSDCSYSCFILSRHQYNIYLSKRATPKLLNLANLNVHGNQLTALLLSSK